MALSLAHALVDAQPPAFPSDEVATFYGQWLNSRPFTVGTALSLFEVEKSKPHCKLQAAGGGYQHHNCDSVSLHLLPAKRHHHFVKAMPPVLQAKGAAIPVPPLQML